MDDLINVVDKKKHLKKFARPNTAKSLVTTHIRGEARHLFSYQPLFLNVHTSLG